MTKTITTQYDVAEHLRTTAEMAAYLEAGLEEANGDATFIAKALGVSLGQMAYLKLHVIPAFLAKVFTMPFQGTKSRFRHNPQSYTASRFKITCRSN